MRIAEVIGRVTLSRPHPNLKGGPVPHRPADDEGGAGRGVADAGRGGRSSSTTSAPAPARLIGLSEGREAANPFGKTKVPIDAYCACLLDRIDV